MRAEVHSVRVNNDGPSVLCLHGFSGTPFGVRYLAMHLGRSGRNTHAPLIAGHGRRLRDLARSRWPDWYATADTALTDLVAARGEPAAIVGYSMGGLLALELARARPNVVSALVLMAPPLRLPRCRKTAYGCSARSFPSPCSAAHSCRGRNSADPTYRTRPFIGQSTG